jgi:hypothetical protein
METRLKALEKAFSDNVAGVHKLINFDRDVLDMAITSMQDLSERLKHHHMLDNPHLTADSTLTLFKQIRTNDSLRPRYQVIFNQAVVLLVSYFSSAVEDIFKAGIDVLLGQDVDNDLSREDIKLTFRQLRDANWHLREIAADLLVEKKDLSFQDMQAIGRAFKTYLGVTIDKDNCVNNIILAQACRHVIVHTGGLVTDRLIHQVANASPRELKAKMTKGEHVQFSPDEVEIVSKSMVAYVQSLTYKVHEALAPQSN